jgi:hypothetical protein
MRLFQGKNLTNIGTSIPWIALKEEVKCMLVYTLICIKTLTAKRFCHAAVDLDKVWTRIRNQNSTRSFDNFRSGYHRVEKTLPGSELTGDPSMLLVLGEAPAL